MSGSLSVSLATATVSIGGVDTAQPITLGVISSGSLSRPSGAQGIMGVAPDDGDGASSGIFSPFIQLTAPYNQGFQLDVPPAGGTGTLTLGRLPQAPEPSPQL